MREHDENAFIKAKKDSFRWQMAALLASIITICSLFGIWYVNNQKAFLQIENKKLAVETEKLKEDIKVLQTAIVQNGEPAPDNNTKPAETKTEAQPAENPPGQSSPAGYEEYVVQPGDTLGGISVSLFGTELYVSQIAELNGINAESILQLNQKLKVPKKPDA